MAADRINLTPYFSRLFSVAEMKSAAELDILIDELSKDPDVELDDTAGMEAIAKRVRKRLATLRKGKRVLKAASSKAKQGRSGKP